MTTTATMLGQSSSLSPFAGPYVGDMLGKGAALASMPYETYMGPLSAGQSQLQNQAFSGLANLAVPQASMAGSFTGSSYVPPTTQQAINSTPTGMAQAVAAIPTANTYSQNDINTVVNAINSGAMTTAQVAEQFGVDEQYVIDNMSTVANSAAPQNGFTPATDSVLQQYMTPYLQGALQPQYDAATRQAQIAQQNLQGQYGKAGAYGGSRQGVAEAELQRGLLDRMAGITGTGYQNAFQQAQNQFNTERGYGLQALAAQQAGGAQQRGIEQEGIGADYAQFREERDDPFKKVQYQQSLLQGLPISTQSYQYAEPSSASQGMSTAGGILGLFDTMGLFGKKEGGT